jgi:hypothetical protein
MAVASFYAGLMRTTFALVFVVASSLLLACGGGGKHFWIAQAQTGPITIQPEQVWAHGHKLWVRVMVMNNTGQMVVIDRDQIVARLPNGAILHRAIGAYSVHEPYVIAPGGGHPVYVEFGEEGFDWHDMASAQIDFSPGTQVNGQPTAVPPLAVTNQ